MSKNPALFRSLRLSHTSQQKHHSEFEQVTESWTELVICCLPWVFKRLYFKFYTIGFFLIFLHEMCSFSFELFKVSKISANCS